VVKLESTCRCIAGNSQRSTMLFLAQPHTFAASMHMELRPTQGVSAAQPAAVLNNAHVQSICLQLLT
jgi:hypothetical protein